MSTFYKVSLALTSIAFAAVGCKKSSSGESASQSSDVQASKPQAETKPTTQDYLLVGAPNAFKGKGAVLICNPDGSSCKTFLGGEDEASVASAKSLKLQEGDKFGSSIVVTANNIFVSAANKQSGSGAVYKFDLSGKNGSALDITDLYQAKQYLGKSMFATAKNLYIGAPERKGDDKKIKGALIKCELDGTNCAVSLGGESTNSSTQVLANTSLLGTYGLGASIFANEKNLFVGAQGGLGKVTKCEADGSNCLPLNLSSSLVSLITNDNFAESMTGDSKYLYIGVPGRDQSALKPSTYDIGGLIRCDIDGGNCGDYIGGTSKVTGGLAFEKNDKFGSSVALSKDGKSIYVGSIGRKTVKGVTFGAIIKCDIEGKECADIVAGKYAKPAVVTPVAPAAPTVTPKILVENNVTTEATKVKAPLAGTEASELKLGEFPSKDEEYLGSDLDSIQGPLVGASVAVATLPIQSQVAAPAAPAASSQSEAKPDSSTNAKPEAKPDSTNAKPEAKPDSSKNPSIVPTLVSAGALVAAPTLFQKIKGFFANIKNKLFPAKVAAVETAATPVAKENLSLLEKAKNAFRNGTSVAESVVAKQGALAKEAALVAAKRL
ncbi:hypothetical protein QEJ31_15060 [Pigmentibacter sp. JX0631]|uniref:hypothetical protein n=1 Tax=Pigmentibacter sp. JX0631 TaxID=2976982 RepID=UPI00246868D4|nr:hypothetical protein [Pigmentibacter sp. JX0631]WGL59849.1 hypothetical protein QEJ31_15060 [Pigmentibacter sp. JX0631]